MSDAIERRSAHLVNCAIGYLEKNEAPPHIVEAVRVAFGGEIALDPCSGPGSAVGALKSFVKPKNKKHIGPDLTMEWPDRTYINPPFSCADEWCGRAVVLARKFSGDSR